MAVGARGGEGEHGDSENEAGGGGQETESEGGRSGSLAGSRAGSRASQQIRVVADDAAIQMRKELGEYFRSTMVHLTNATDVPLHLTERKCSQGIWYRKGQPPTTIEPHSEVIFATTSKLRWAGSTDAELSYDTRNEGNGAPSEIRMVSDIHKQFSPRPAAWFPGMCL